METSVNFNVNIHREFLEFIEENYHREFIEELFDIDFQLSELGAPSLISDWLMVIVIIVTPLVPSINFYK